MSVTVGVGVFSGEVVGVDETEVWSWGTDVVSRVSSSDSSVGGVGEVDGCWVTVLMI